MDELLSDKYLHFLALISRTESYWQHHHPKLAFFDLFKWTMRLSDLQWDARWHGRHDSKAHMTQMFSRLFFSPLSFHIIRGQTNTFRVNLISIQTWQPPHQRCHRRPDFNYKETFIILNVFPGCIETAVLAIFTCVYMRLSWAWTANTKAGECIQGLCFISGLSALAS